MHEDQTNKRDLLADAEQRIHDEQESNARAAGGGARDEEQADVLADEALDLEDEDHDTGGEG
ncbi:hypothetical protein Lfu02_39520 [Longispora fulva]|uniref:Uncharacterized protein n=1 Tax=Longispora fulva TaxID=619741 RepID=A0A8J7KWD3_9ACTN|nr:hypothetical protein [Longispora fulva]MBG6136412.1 hypothetical protein [Longispora fulva]GIG59580.1 hypothetical protein Lfu02_39520 [Longispora fulva]